MVMPTRFSAFVMSRSRRESLPGSFYATPRRIRWTASSAPPGRFPAQLRGERPGAREPAGQAGPALPVRRDVQPVGKLHPVERAPRAVPCRHVLALDGERTALVARA